MKEKLKDSKFKTQPPLFFGVSFATKRKKKETFKSSQSFIEDGFHTVTQAAGQLVAAVLLTYLHKTTTIPDDSLYFLPAEILILYIDICMCWDSMVG